MVPEYGVGAEMTERVLEQLAQCKQKHLCGEGGDPIASRQLGHESANWLPTNPCRFFYPGMPMICHVRDDTSLMPRGL